MSVDVVGLVDEWAARFFEELDYVNEGENGMLFSEMMRKDLPQVSLMHDSLMSESFLELKYSVEAKNVIARKSHFQINARTKLKIVKLNDIRLKFLSKS